MPSEDNKKKRPEHGENGGYYKVSTFLRKSPDEVVKSIRKKVKKYYNYATKEETRSHDESNVKAWTDCCTVLHETFSNLPEYSDLSVVFEYVLPRERKDKVAYRKKRHGRADVILVSENKILVMEFKQYNGEKEDKKTKYIKQVEEYRQSLADCHKKSANMDIRSLVVLTKAEGAIPEKDGVLFCSPASLAETIRSFMGNNPKPYRSFDRWIDSDFVYNNHSIKAQD